MMVLFVGAMLHACSHPERAPPPALDATLDAVVIDAPHVRFWPARQTTEFAQEVERALQREMADRNVSDYNQLPAANILALSGGGDNGAFGAGLLVGWTESGTRPEFKAVTGVSTGGLTAPFAFLGPAYDDALREVYTTVTAGDIFEERGVAAALFDDAMADSAPLLELISKHVDDDMLEAIAREHARGRLLLIMTTNLDVGEPVIWNIGAIASSRHPKAADLIRKVMLASASVPGALPPVMIDVDVDGKQYQEMHVDGGATAQLFLYPSPVGKMRRAAGMRREVSAFIIRNGRLGDDWKPVERRTLDVAGRAISMMIVMSGLNDVLRTYVVTKRDGVDYNLAYIEDDFVAPERDGAFDRAFMNALFDYGYKRARKGMDWRKEPPYSEGWAIE